MNPQAIQNIRGEYRKRLSVVYNSPNPGVAAATVQQQLQRPLNDLVDLQSRTDLSSSLQRMIQDTINNLLNVRTHLERFQVPHSQSNVRVRGNINNDLDNNSVRWINVESVFRNRMISAIIVNMNDLDLKNFFIATKNILIEKIRKFLLRFNSVKINIVLACEFEVQKNDSIEIEIKYFNDKCLQILRATDLDSIIDDCFLRINTDVEGSELQGSGWTLREILHLEVQMNKWKMLRGGSSSFAPIPCWVQLIRSVVNVENFDEKCFLWFVLAGICKLDTHADRVDQYLGYENNFIINGLEFPVSWKDIKIFEKLNHLKINIYGLEDINQEDDDDDNYEIDNGYRNNDTGNNSKDTVDDVIIDNYSGSNHGNKKRGKKQMKTAGSKKRKSWRL